MAGRAPSEKDFAKVLEMGAQVDDIFKDTPVPQGSNPYNQLDGGLPSSPQSDAVVSSLVESQGTSVSAGDSDSVFCLNRKFAAVETLFKLIGRDYYSFGQLVSEILRAAVEQIRSESGSFIEVDYANNQMFFRAATGRDSENLFNFTIPIGKGVVGYVCESQQPMVLANVDDSKVYLRSISDAVGFETRNLMAYPVIIRGVTFGAIELLNRLGEPNYTEADREVMTTIADYAAKVIENRLMMASLAKEIAELKVGTTGREVA